MNDILIHIGYHKTGTTWLQENLFVLSSEVFYPLDLNKNSLSKKFVTGEDKYVLSPFDMNEGPIFGELQYYREKGYLDNDKVKVLSHERLSGHPHGSALDSQSIANRLHNIFPNAKIFIVIREQKSFLLSIYFQYLLGGGVHSLKQYLGTTFDRKRSYFSPNHINYVPLIKAYQKLFGKEKVLVLPYEMFKHEPNNFISRLAKFVEKEILVDPSLFDKYSNMNKNVYIKYHLRKLSYFMYSNSLNNYSKYNNTLCRGIAIRLRRLLERINFQKKGNNLKHSMSGYIAEWVGDRFHSSNEELSELINIDLGSYGYH